MGAMSLVGPRSAPAFQAQFHVSEKPVIRQHGVSLRLAHFDGKLLKIPFAEHVGGEASICLNDPRNAACPSGLMTGADASAVVAMEVLVEKNVVSPMRVGLEFLRASKNRSAPRAVPDKCADEALCQLLCDLE